MKARMSITVPPDKDWSPQVVIEADDLPALVNLATRRAWFSLCFALATKSNDTGLGADVLFTGLFAGREHKIMACIETEEGLSLIDIPVTWDECGEWVREVLIEFVEHGGKLPTLGW